MSERKKPTIIYAEDRESIRESTTLEIQDAGYSVVPFENGKPIGQPEDFLTGFIADESKNEVYGKPVGMLVMADGSILVADDAGNTIWRVSKK